MPVQTFKGPWGGMDMREGEAAPNSYFLGLNVDTSAGQLAARPPLGVVVTGAPAFARMHYVDQPGAPRIILAVGQASTDAGASITFRVYTTDYEAVASAQDLTATFGEPASDAFLCSFVSAFIRPTDTGEPRPVVLVVTPSTTYVYDLVTNTGALRLAVPSTDASRINAANLYYVNRPMPGPIAESHQTRVYYAGFRSGDQANLTAALPAASAGKANNPPEAHVSADRGALHLAPHVFMWSDENDPIGVASVNFAMVDPSERITGLHSAGEALIVLTDKGLWAKVGSTIADFAVVKLAHNVGCVAHESVITVGGVTYFAGRDGIYAFGGMGAPEAIKISPHLDPLWEGSGSTAGQLPEAFRTYLSAALGWPWKVDQQWTPRMVGRHYAKPNQIWWSLPVVSTWASRAMGLTLVYDVQGNAWNVYFTYASLRAGSYLMGSNYCTAMCDAVQVDGRWIASSGTTELRELGIGRWDGTEDATVSYSQGVPVYWLSRRFPDSGDDFLDITGIRFKVLARGLAAGLAESINLVGSDQVSASRPMWLIEGEEAAFDYETDETTPVTDYDQRQTRTGEIKGYPRATSDSFLGSMVFGTSKLAPVDWWTFSAPVMMRSRWFRIGFRDDCGAANHAPVGGYGRRTLAQFSSIGVEIANTGSTRR